MVAGPEERVRRVVQANIAHTLAVRHGGPGRLNRHAIDCSRANLCLAIRQSDEGYVGPGSCAVSVHDRHSKAQPDDELLQPKTRSANDTVHLVQRLPRQTPSILGRHAGIARARWRKERVGAGSVDQIVRLPAKLDTRAAAADDQSVDHAVQTGGFDAPSAQKYCGSDHESAECAECQNVYIYFLNHVCALRMLCKKRIEIAAQYAQSNRRTPAAQTSPMASPASSDAEMGTHRRIHSV